MRETKRREPRKGRVGEMDGWRGLGKKAESLRSRAMNVGTVELSGGAPSLQT